MGKFMPKARCTEVGMSALFSRGRADQRRLEGRIDLSNPFSWHAITYLLVGIVVGAIIILGTQTYTRNQTASGTITVDRGVSRISPTRGGVVAEILVKEGDSVQAGQKLVVINSEDRLIEGEPASEQSLQALDRQRDLLNEQINALGTASEEEQAGIRQRLVSLRNEASAIETQISDQQQLIHLAQQDYERGLELAEKGYITKRDLGSREAATVSRRQQLAALRQLLASKQAEIASADRSIAQSSAASRGQGAAIAAAMTSLTQQSLQSASGRGYALIAPISGKVAVASSNVGETVAPGQELFIIIPNGSKLQAELIIAPENSGLIREGQTVKLAVDAFPFQTFGTVDGRIDSISDATILRNGKNGPTPVYVARVDISEPSVGVFGKRETLRVGMSVSASVVVSERSLLEWLFEPIYSVAQR